MQGEAKFFSGRPFDEDRLSGLLKGLEISILELSAVLTANRDKRLDSQYFGSVALAADQLIAHNNPEPLSRLASDIRSFGAYALTNEFEYQEEGIPFLRGTNYSGNFINFSDVLRISEGAHRLLHKSEVLPGMVLLSMSGSVGSVAVALENWAYPINSNQDIAKIIPKGVSPFYLASYLSSKFGQIQIDRLPVGSVQQHIFLWMIERLQIPRFTDLLEDRIAAIAAQAYLKNETVAHSFRQAEDTLMSALGLSGWRPPAPLAYSARAAEVFASGRIDAQYFRPLFAEVEARLQATGAAIELGSILSANARGRQPLYQETGLPVVNSKHVRTHRVVLGDNRTAVEKDAPLVIQTGDVLLNGTGVGTIGRAAPYLHQIPALPDNHVTVLRTDAVDPVYLSVFLNSPLGQWQIERHIKGSSGQIELYPGDIARIVVWDAPNDVQQSVRMAILSAFDEERWANDLLEVAKHAVEIAIEDGELAGMSYLDQQEEVQ